MSLAKSVESILDRTVEGELTRALVSVPFQFDALSHSYKFRQRSNLWYLTGWEEPDSVLVLRACDSPYIAALALDRSFRPFN